MTITENQVEIVQNTFTKVAPIATQAADMFYKRLFEIAPHTQPLFKATNMQVQGNKLMEMLGTAVAGLSNLEALIPAVKNLGMRHVAYGVKDDDYQPVGAALLWTLEQGLGSDFTPEVKEAWTAVYTVLAETAIAGTKAPEQPEIPVDQKRQMLVDAIKNQKSVTGFDLRGADLSHLDLTRVDLSDAKLNGAAMHHVQLGHSKLNGADLSGANLANANLTCAELQGANLKGVNMGNINLQGANLSGSNLHGAVLVSANLREAILCGANMSGAMLIGANFTNADLSDARLRGANLTLANLSTANKTNIDTIGAIGYSG